MRGGEKKQTLLPIPATASVQRPDSTSIWRPRRSRWERWSCSDFKADRAASPYETLFVNTDKTPNSRLREPAAAVHASVVCVIEMGHGVRMVGLVFFSTGSSSLQEKCKKNQPPP